MQCYDKNLSQLKRINSQLADAVEKIQPNSGMALIDTHSGPKTLRVTAENGTDVFLHSKYDPLKEAARLIDNFPAKPLENYVLLGLGLGYHLSELAGRLKKESYIFVIEKDASLLKTSLQTIDWSVIFANPNVILLVGIDPAEIFKHLRHYLSKIFSGGTTIIAHPPSMLAFPSFYELAKKNFVEFIKSGLSIYSTTLVLPKKTCVNRIKNLPEYLLSPGISEFEHRFKGCPAIVVSAGPSLNKNIAVLKKAQSGAVIIAVSTSVKKLLSSGVTPHFTAILDYHDISKRYFEGVDAKHDIIMVTDPRGNHEAIKAFAGRKIFPNDEFINITLKGMNIWKGHLEHGATVAHLAFLFAWYIGADPIILAGQDLSYPDGVTHIPGTAIYTQWRQEVNRFYTFETKEWEYIMRYKDSLTKIKDVNGNEVYTDNNMLGYLKDFNLLCESVGVKCINSTEGGADIKHTEKMPLKEAIEKFCSREIPGEKFKASSLTDDEKNALKKKAVLEIDRRLEECMELDKLYNAALKFLEKAKKKIDAGENADPAVLKVLKLKEKITQYEEIFQILSNIAKSDSVLSEKWDRRILAEDMKGTAKQREQAERNLVYLNALKKASEFYVDLLEGTRAELIRSSE
ncbi:MAG: motility associated factor glycosyltransferase family protein [Planctomycetes bacterium]|nr:motility associated factor glycosyltransferase family protein [Planctomycetota bacterium]